MSIPSPSDGHRPVAIISDSVTGISHGIAEEMGIRLVTLFVNEGGREYADATMDIDEFYSRIGQMVDPLPTSSQPARGEVLAAFTEEADAGRDVVAIFMSSKMSGTYVAAVDVVREVASTHPGWHCHVIDSATNSYDEGLPVLAGARLARQGASVDEVACVVCAAVPCCRFLFAPASFKFLRAGGRIGSAAALAAGILRLAPVLTVSQEETSVFGKVRTYPKALSLMASTFKKEIDAHGLVDVVVHYIGPKGPAQKWESEVIRPIVGHAVDLVPVSPVIGTHVGPAVGIAYQCLSVLPGKVDRVSEFSL